MLEPYLRGKPGAKRVEVTARGKVVAELATRPDVPGRNIRLTIDAGLQEYAARRLGTNSGSAVVLDCRTGETLAMVSMPAYDPNSFSDGISHLEWAMLSENDHVPLMNKVTQGLYPPGSTVKPMNGLALLEAGVANDRVLCTGAMRVGTGVFHCHKRGGHGALNLKGAIEQSCDIYFYEMIRRMGYDRIAPIARMVGLGQKFDLPLSTQRYGTVPDAAWKLKKYKTKWTVADGLNASIGQGYVLANPLQLAVMAARLASGRHLAQHALASGPSRRPGPARRVRASGDRARCHVRCRQPGRHRRRGADAGPRRQPGGQDRHGAGPPDHHGRAAHGRAQNGQLPFKLRDHALLVCFAPADNPRYAAAVVLEHNGHTVRNLDAPLIGRDIMTYLFDRDRALASLAEGEQSWGGDINTRMRAEEAAYRAAHSPQPAAAATKTDAGAATDAPAVEAATNVSDAQAEAMATRETDPEDAGDPNP